MSQSRINERQAALLRCIWRYIIVMPWALRRCVWPEIGRAAATKRVSRMCSRQLVRRYELEGGGVYYGLDKMAERFMRIPPRLLKPPGPQAFELHRAVLHYCCLGPRNIERLTADELHQAFPSLPQSELNLPFYLDPKGFLGLFHLVNPTKHVPSVVKDCRRLIAQRIEVGAPYCQMMEKGKFGIVLMTYSDRQRLAIAKQIGTPEEWVFGRAWKPVTVRVHTIPGISD